MSFVLQLMSLLYSQPSIVTLTHVLFVAYYSEKTDLRLLFANTVVLFYLHVFGKVKLWMLLLLGVFKLNMIYILLYTQTRTHAPTHT